MRGVCEAGTTLKALRVERGSTELQSKYWLGKRNTRHSQKYILGHLMCTTDKNTMQLVTSLFIGYSAPSVVLVSCDTRGISFYK